MPRGKCLIKCQWLHNPISDTDEVLNLGAGVKGRKSHTDIKTFKTASSLSDTFSCTNLPLPLKQGAVLLSILILLYGNSCLSSQNRNMKRLSGSKRPKKAAGGKFYLAPRL